MKLLLATGLPEINKFIEKNYPKIEISDILMTSEKLYEVIKETSPDKVLITSELYKYIGESEKQILRRIVSETDTKILFIYASNLEDEEAKNRRIAFINFLLSIGVYDYTYNEINQEELKSLLFEEKTYQEMKKDMVTKLDPTSEISEQADKVIIKTNIMTVKQRIIGLFGGNGRTTNGLNLAAAIAINIPDLDVCFLELDTKKTSLHYYLSSQADNLSKFKAEISSKTDVVQEGNIFKLLKFTPFQNIKNFSVIHGFSNEAETYNSEFKLNQDDIDYIINKLTQIYHCIIIDTSGHLKDTINNNIYDKCNTKLFFLEQTLPSLALHRVLDLNKHIKHDDNLLCVVNRFDEGSEITISHILDTLEVKTVLPIKEQVRHRETMYNRELLYLRNDDYKNDIDKLIEEILEIEIIENDKKRTKLFNLLKVRFPIRRK